MPPVPLSPSSGSCAPSAAPTSGTEAVSSHEAGHVQQSAHPTTGAQEVNAVLPERFLPLSEYPRNCDDSFSHKTHQTAELCPRPCPSTDQPAATWDADVPATPPHPNLSEVPPCPDSPLPLVPPGACVRSWQHRRPAGAREACPFCLVHHGLFCTGFLSPQPCHLDHCLSPLSPWHSFHPRTVGTNVWATW